MEKDERLEIIEARNYKIVKSNDIIQKARYDLGLTELKAFSFVVSKIKPTDKELKEYTFTINEYCKLLGIDTNNGKNIRTIKKTLKQLVDKSFYITLEDGTETTISWFNKVWINKGSGRIRVRLDDDLQKYLIGLYENFTQYEFLCTLPMQSAFSIRIYELLKSYAYRHKVKFEIEDLKKSLACEHYSRFPDFRRRVLEVAVKEINEFSDIEVSWQPITKGKKVIELEFYIKQRDSWARLEKHLHAAEKLNKNNNGQLTIDEYLEQSDNQTIVITKDE